MIELKASLRNTLTKFDTSRKIKSKIKGLILPTTLKKLSLKDVLYERVTIDELFN